jgi:CRP/FNR family transcriptional regulator
MNVLRELAQRLRKFSALIGDLSLLTVPQRLAKLLVERARSGGRHHATQREMAAQLGTVREVVARSLSQFEDQGWVRVGRGVIEILDADMLEEYALTGEGM